MEDSMNTIESLNEILELLESGEITEEMAKKLLSLF